MAQEPANALYIGTNFQIGDVLSSIRPEWNFLPHISSIAELWQGLNSQTITNDIQALFILDSFFDQSGVDSSFEDFIAQMGPYCYLGILSYRPELQELIVERVNDAAYRNGTEPLYYFISKNDPINTINKGLSQFINTDRPDLDSVKDRLLGRETVRPQFSVAQADKEVFSYENELKTETETGGSKYLGNVVAVTSSKGGAGKSTVAISLSTLLAHASINSVREGLEERPLKIILIDLDVREGQIGFITNNSKPTVLNLRLNGINDETLEDTIIHSPRLKVDLILAPKKPRASDDTPPEFYLELIQRLRKSYDYVILDTSVNYLDPLLENVAYPIANKIVFVTDIVINSIFSMTRWIQEVTYPKEKNGMGIDPRKIGIVVNKSLDGVHMPGEKISLSALGLPVITAIPSNPKLIAHAANLQTMETILKHGALHKAFLRLAKSITGSSYKLSNSIAP